MIDRIGWLALCIPCHESSDAWTEALDERNTSSEWCIELSLRPHGQSNVRLI